MRLPSVPKLSVRRPSGRAVLSGVELVLAVALAFPAARLVWTVAEPAGPIGAARSAPAAARADFSALDRFNPFFRTGVADPDAAAAATGAAGFQLFGVRTGADGGSAIIAASDGEQGSYAVGDEVAPGVKLKSVGPAHVILARAGGALRLDMPTTAVSSGLAPYLPAASASPTSAGPVDPTRLIQEAGLKTRTAEDGRVTGYTLLPRGRGELLRQVGLQEGDVLLSVNGDPLDPERVGDLERELAGSPEVVLTFERGGQVRTTTLQMARP